VDLAGARVVALLTRAPSAGGKTRLFEALGRPVDPTLLAALLLDTYDAAAAASTTVIVAEPPEACDELRHLTGAVVMPQATGALGVRMQSAMRELFGRGAAAVALVGSDLPDLDPQAITRAFAFLDADPRSLVLGPAADGGYYLLAAAHVPAVFDGIDWGTPRVLGQTLAAASRAAIGVHLLAPMHDVDRPEDLRRVRAARTRRWVVRCL
jgi:rSAM/selenodomain-associated transferase 1